MTACGLREELIEVETLECTECKNTVLIVETSKDFAHRGEMNLVFVCPNKRCKALVRLPLLEYGKKQSKIKV